MAVLLTMALLTVTADGAQDGPLAGEAQEFLKTYCVQCHRGEKPKGKLDLTQFQMSESLRTESKRWSKIIARVQAGEMPPAGSPAPPPEERQQFAVAVMQALLAAICDGSPRPGPAPMRRLSRTEYGATLRDLLGIQATVTQLLPDEGAGGEGFDNAAETLFISPLHAEKYLEAARAALDYASKDPRSRSTFLSTRPRGEGGFRGRRGGPPAAPEPPLSAEAAKTLLERFLPRAFRRPVRE